MNKELFLKAVVVATMGAVVLASRAVANEVDLTAAGTASGTIVADFGGPAIFERANTQPTGTGVFQPFFTLDSNGQTSTTDKHLEQGYNTDNSSLPLDDLRKHWNTNLRLGDLGSVVRNGQTYFVFELDANETGVGNDNRFLSIDNIRIYTSPTGSQNTSNIESLGVLRFALNNPNVISPPGPASNNWILIDSTRNTPLQPQSGQGASDMYAYIPTTMFESLDPNLCVYFYNFNGGHYMADGSLDSGTGSSAGYEEWSALQGPQATVPDGGATLTLMGIALGGVFFIRRKLA
jgi:hypothetical protein